MNLRDLLHGISAEPISALPVSGIACHSKQVRPGDLFIAVEGAATDGHAFIEEAVVRGASAVIAQRLPNVLQRSGAQSGAIVRPCPCVIVQDSSKALATLAARFYGHPSSKLQLIGVTGTNGKTTTVYLLKAILDASGARCGLLGTIAYKIGDRLVPSTNTTPGALELQRYFAQMVASGLGWCAMEVSSHALAQGRVSSLEFDAAVFSNLGSDHLDYHKTREAYAAAKRRLFGYLKPNGYALLNVDDEFGRTLSATLSRENVITYGIEHPAKVSVKEICSSWSGLQFVLDSPWGIIPLKAPLLGRHNVWNIVSASSAALALRVPSAAVRDGLASIEQIPGRLECVPNELGMHVIIDYAHTADAIRLVLLSLRELTRGRLIIVFGCGGNRDQSKRPMMGKMASILADHIVLTSDNPRGEDPLEIISQVKSGFVPGFRQFDIVADREQAISAALSIARQDDTVLIAGKGHEAYQICDNVSIPFSDRDVAERLLSTHQSFALS